MTDRRGQMRWGAVEWAGGGKALAAALLRPVARRAYRLLTRNRDWSEIELDILDLIVAPERLSFDVGANLGEYARRLAALTCGVYAFEPDPAMAAALTALAIPNLHVFQAALSDVEGDRTFRVPKVDGRLEPAMGSLEPIGGATVQYQVDSWRMDRFADLDVGFLKIDVEGHEIEVLRGGRELIARQRPVVLVEAEERHRQGSLAAVRAYFDDLGYEGRFIYRRQCLPLGRLRPEMTDPRELRRAVARKEAGYVNNFLFFPTADAAALADRRIVSFFAAPAA